MKDPTESFKDTGKFLRERERSQRSRPEDAKPYGRRVADERLRSFNKYGPERQDFPCVRLLPKG